MPEPAGCHRQAQKERFSLVHVQSRQDRHPNFRRPEQDSGYVCVVQRKLTIVLLRNPEPDSEVSMPLLV
jgi:hypothetical protein